MNPYDEIHRGRVSKAMEHSYRRIAPFRALNAGLIEEYSGSSYSVGRVRRQILLNLINQLVVAYTMTLAANRPRVLVTTRNSSMDQFAPVYQEAINRLIEEIHLEDVLRQAVLEAFFCIGIVKTHVADSVEVEIENGFWMDPGQPYASNILLDDWVYDTSATTWHKVQFAADCYRIPYDSLKSDIFDQKVASELSPTTKYNTNDSDNRVENISKGYETDWDEVEPQVDVMDVWIPRDRKIYTFPMDPGRRFAMKWDPLAVIDQDDPEIGPYHILGFHSVPGNIMPASPASHLSEMARLINNVMRKQGARARNLKEIMIYTPAGGKDAQSVQRTSDGGSAEVGAIDEVGTYRFGGVDSASQMFLGELIQYFDRMGGNLTAMLGLGAQAETAAQEKLIHGAVSQTEAQMMARTLDFSSKVIRDLGWMLWRDVMKTIPGQIPIDGAEGYFLDATWTPDYREGNFSDYDLQVDVYSMSYQSPGQRVQMINDLITNIYAKILPLLQQQGGTIDVRELTEIYADLLNLPRLKKAIQFAFQPAMDEAASSPNSTSREYVRRSVSGNSTVPAQSQVRQQAWAHAAGQAGQPGVARFNS